MHYVVLPRQFSKLLAHAKAARLNSAQMDSSRTFPKLDVEESLSMESFVTCYRDWAPNTHHCITVCPCLSQHASVVQNTAPENVWLGFFDRVQMREDSETQES